MSWVEALKKVGGRLVEGASEFVRWQALDSPEAGPSGVRWLAERIDWFLDQEPDDEVDGRFVEGAGAFLGVLLIDHLGGRAQIHEGAHRVQLGRYGWFDPFHAIEQALDAENPRQSLSESLVAAEREATGTGDVSRVVSLFAKVLADERPGVEIESQIGLAVDLSNGATVDLARLEKVSQAGDAHAAVEAARRIVSMMPGASGPEETDWSEARLRILPRLVSQSFLGTIPHEEGLFRQALGHDVHITLQLRYGTRARYVRSAEVEHWGLGDGALGHAVLNLAERTRELRVEPVEDGLLRVRQGDGLDGSRLILPDLAARLQTLGGGDWLAAAPHRDVLLLARAEQLPTLVARAQDASERAPHPISAAVFAVRENQLRPVTA